MALGRKISEQSVADSLSGGELFPFAKNGANGAVSSDTIKEYVLDGIDESGRIPTKVSELENDEKYQTESEVDNKLTDKVDKEDGKGLSSNDYTDTDKSKLDALPTKEELSQKLSEISNDAIIIDEIDIAPYLRKLTSEVSRFDFTLPSATSRSIADKVISAYKTNKNLYIKNPS